MAPTTTTMTQHLRHANTIGEDVASVDIDIVWPFENIDGLHRDHFRDAAYEIFFTACRSSPGFGGRTAFSYHNPSEGGDGSGSRTGSTSPGSPVKPSGVGMAVRSKVKTALGLKMLKRSRSRRTSSYGGTPSSPGAGASPKVGFTVLHPRARRPMASGEIMRRQMRVSDQSDSRLRKTLMRTLVGQLTLQNLCSFFVESSKNALILENLTCSAAFLKNPTNIDLYDLPSVNGFKIQRADEFN
ncbi:hypothetical protein RND71_040162 [Anisodus tanguticus]|uniref:Uncharacterized protein n=1 Tax=Anisodus tanguticus TaxID=243964 RepID=A0AAE1QY69_9SOLA|nr:hypothetical protein RND71_040162 [Anisodus tanguticus]